MNPSHYPMPNAAEKFEDWIRVHPLARPQLERPRLPACFHARPRVKGIVHQNTGATSGFFAETATPRLRIAS